MTWKKLQWAKKKNWRREIERKGVREKETEKMEWKSGIGKGWSPMSFTTKGQSLVRATTYQAVNGTAMLVLGCFSRGWIFTTRDITLSCPLSPFFPLTDQPTPLLTNPVDLSRVWPLSCCFYIIFSTHVC